MASIVELGKEHGADAVKFKPQLTDEALAKLKAALPDAAYISWLGFSMGKLGFKGQVEFASSVLEGLIPENQKFLPAMVIYSEV